MHDAELVKGLNHPDKSVRLESLRALVETTGSGRIGESEGRYVNNHIHTTYSFSPYSPTKAVWMAHNAGLTTAGIMDHDSISGAWEFIAAGRIMGLATTIGIECRADFSGTPLQGKFINNPDQKSIAYLALHGIPHTQIGEVEKFIAPYAAERNKRNRAMVEKLNELFAPYDVFLDFAEDVAALSMVHEGGSITERHILFALGKKLIERFGRGRALVKFLKGSLNLKFSTKLEGFLMDPENQYYEYDLLGVLKGDLVKSFYIDAATECPDVSDVTSLAKRVGAIPAYAYLGDVKESVTGDKKPQKFEDDYLDLLFEVLKGLGFSAVTYMPSRNSPEQLLRVKGLCRQYGFFEISGEDINSPRQSFVCKALQKEEFSNLIDSTWALIGHELEATKDLARGMFSDETIARYPDLAERIQVFKELGKAGSARRE